MDEAGIETGGDPGEAGEVPGPAGAAPRTGVPPALWALVERTLEGLGLELVDLERAGGGLLRVTIDVAPSFAAAGAAASAGFAPAPANAGSAEADAPAAAKEEAKVSIDDCERVSRQLSHLFTVEAVDYQRLEVSSPGIDRPLRREQDFERFAGGFVKLQLAAPVDGRRKLRARLLGLAGEAGARRLRLRLLPDAPAPSVPGRRRPVARRPPVEGPEIELELAAVVKARLLPDWEVEPRGGRA